MVTLKHTAGHSHQHVLCKHLYQTVSLSEITVTRLPVFYPGGLFLPSLKLDVCLFGLWLATESSILEERGQGLQFWYVS